MCLRSKWLSLKRKLSLTSLLLFLLLLLPLLPRLPPPQVLRCFPALGGCGVVTLRPPGGRRGQADSWSHDGGRTRQHPAPTRDAGMSAWIGNSRSEAEFCTFKFRWVSSRWVLCSPMIKGQVLAQGTKGCSHGQECPRMEGGSEGRW